MRNYLNGRITNWDLDDSGDRLEDDGACEIWGIIWTTYSDFPEFRAVGDRQVEGDLRQQYLRAILFLDTDLEYEWPPWDAIEAPGFPWLRNLLTRRRFGREFHVAEAARIMSWKDAGGFDFVAICNGGANTTHPSKSQGGLQQLKESANKSPLPTGFSSLTSELSV